MSKCTQTKLKKLASKQKQTIRIFENENCNIKESMTKMKILNIYKLKHLPSSEFYASHQN